jgi:hypothetical protein
MKKKTTTKKATAKPRSTPIAAAEVAKLNARVEKWKARVKELTAENRRLSAIEARYNLMLEDLAQYAAADDLIGHNHEGPRLVRKELDAMPVAGARPFSRGMLPGGLYIRIDNKTKTFEVIPIEDWHKIPQG